jgi:hypothetical protein
VSALRVNTSSGNTAVGVNALVANQTAFNNTAIGANALINQEESISRLKSGSAKQRPQSQSSSPLSPNKREEWKLSLHMSKSRIQKSKA